MAKTKLDRLLKKQEQMPRPDRYASKKQLAEYDALVREIDLELDAYQKRNPKEFKAQGGTTKFPDLNKDGKVTKADILKGRGVPGFGHGGAMCSPRKEAAGAMTMPTRNATRRNS